MEAYYSTMTAVEISPLHLNLIQYTCMAVNLSTYHKAVLEIYADKNAWM